MESFHVPTWDEDKSILREGKEFYLYTIPDKTARS